MAGSTVKSAEECGTIGLNTIFAIIDFVIALLYSGIAYDVGTAYLFTPNPHWSAEQLQANRQTMRASYFLMGMAVASGAAIVPLSILLVPFWSVWWGVAAAVWSIALVVALPILRRMARDIKAQRYRLLPDN